jgi:hypothetical protein
MDTYPPVPWHLTGTSIQIIKLVDVSRVRALVPQQLRIVPLLPGKTLAVLYCARYSAQSTLAYHELLVAPAIVRDGGRVGFWISHIYVDSPASASGGQHIWGLPKQLATFHWNEADREVRVDRESSLLCRIAWSSGPTFARVPALLPVISGRSKARLFFSATGSCRIGFRRAQLDVGEALPDLGFARSRHAVLGSGLRLRVPAPR